ncbi:UNKNOWN [Stylonychia lemnae]|uniref:Uncharacterized protein n=1 Tax=Stylonychia lemnae TaxID=5949 RepID=A0A078ACV3_STYLE|nr:UNKNOWN [Stylonychia lemnae]|eukprot:CDW80034.1 UNKNOWN [Stylonychia lemnae]
MEQDDLRMIILNNEMIMTVNDSNCIQIDAEYLSKIPPQLLDSGMSAIMQAGVSAAQITISAIFGSNIILAFLLLIYDLANLNLIPVDGLQKIMFSDLKFSNDDPEDNIDDYYPINIHFYQMGYEILIYPFFILALLQYKFKDLKKDYQRSRIGSLYGNLNLESRWTLLNLPLQIIRRNLFSVIFIYLDEIQVLQSFFAIMSSLLMMVFYLRVKPFKSYAQSMIEFFNEGSQMKKILDQILDGLQLDQLYFIYWQIL